MTSPDQRPPRPLFPLVRRGYDPDAVRVRIEQLEATVEQLEGDQAGPRDEAERILEAAHARAAEVLEDAHQRREAAHQLLDEAQALTAAEEQTRSEAAAEVAQAAEAVIASAQERAAAIVAEAEATLARAQTDRWADVADRVGRILSVAEGEGAGIVADAVAAAEAASATAAADSARERSEADRYAAETRNLAEEWASARIAAADADQAKASEILEEARARALRVQHEAEVEATRTYERADKKVTEHVQTLLSQARYDLDQLEARAAEARSHLQSLREVAVRSLEGETARPSASLGDAASFVLRVAAEPDDVAAEAGDDAGGRPVGRSGSGGPAS